MPDRAIDIVTSWLARLNAGDIDGVLELTADGISIVGPRGTNEGKDILRQWLGAVGATFQTREVYGREGRIVVSQLGQWRDGTTGMVSDAEVATRFRLAEGLVAELERFDDLEEALRSAALDRSDLLEGKG